MSFFKFTISGLENIENDYAKIETAINKQIPKALLYAGSEMVANLQKHIESDVYDEYSPKVYERRGYSGGLPSTEYMNYFTVGNNFVFTYKPLGTHENPDWSTAYGDNLIKIIQSGKSYKFKPKNVGERPFWNNFVDDQSNGEFMKNFAKGMSPFELNYSASDLVLDGSEKL